MLNTTHFIPNFVLPCVHLFLRPTDQIILLFPSFPFSVSNQNHREFIYSCSNSLSHSNSGIINYPFGPSFSAKVPLRSCLRWSLTKKGNVLRKHETWNKTPPSPSFVSATKDKNILSSCTYTFSLATGPFWVADYCREHRLRIMTGQLPLTVTVVHIATSSKPLLPLYRSIPVQWNSWKRLSVTPVLSILKETWTNACEANHIIL